MLIIGIIIGVLWMTLGMLFTYLNFKLGDGDDIDSIFKLILRVIGMPINGILLIVRFIKEFNYR